MKMLVLMFMALACWSEDLVHKIGPYTVNTVKKFTLVEVGKDPDGNDGITLAEITSADEGGVVIHLVFMKERLDVETLANEEVVPKKQRDQVKPVTTPLKVNGLEGARTTVAYRDDDVGEAVTEVGILGKDAAWVHWEIHATKKVYEAELKTITAIIQSIK